MKTYLQIMIQTHWTATVTLPPILCNHLHSAEGFLKKVCATNSVQNVSKQLRNDRGHAFPQMTGMTDPPSPLPPKSTLTNHTKYEQFFK